MFDIRYEPSMRRYLCKTHHLCTTYYPCIRHLLASLEEKINLSFIIKSKIFLNLGLHCEINIDDCLEDSCKNGAQCEDLINDFRCICTSFFSGQFCETKNAELEMKENVSRSFSVLAILFIILTYAFFISLDILKFVFKIEPESLSRERDIRKKKKLMKKIMEDMKDKKKRRQYRKLIQSVYNQKDPFIAKIEKTFQITYDVDLDWIDTDSSKLNYANV